MSGIIVSVKGRYAVLLTKNSDFIKVKNKNYSVGDKVKIPQYKGQILAAAASFIVVCGGISSYFVPAKYMSVDINPSVMMTINIYNRVINTKPLNDDAEILLSSHPCKRYECVGQYGRTYKKVGRNRIFE